MTLWMFQSENSKGILQRDQNDEATISVSSGQQTHDKEKLTTKMTLWMFQFENSQGILQRDQNNEATISV
jgi:hypothetical protein